MVRNDVAEAPWHHDDRKEHLAMCEDLLNALYWLLLCGPATLGLALLWWEYRRIE